ncbi:MAG: glycosyl hydrolase family 95 catalytic domain-containing protein [Terriglobia bacterium]
MKSTRRQFLQTSAVTTVAGAIPVFSSPAAVPAVGQLDAFQIARQHLIVRDVPGPDFFEGMLLGNGDLGVCAVVRPDALGLHLGKSDSWDIRVSEDIEKYILSFQDLLKLWKRASDEARRLGKPDMLYLETNISFFRDYTRKVESSYSRPWPRPWPCGTVWIHWDPRWVHVSKQVLDPSNGLFTLDLALREPNQPGSVATLSTFVDWATGLVSISTDAPLPLLSIDCYPELDEGRGSPIGFGESQSAGALLPPPEIDGKASTDFAEFSSFQYFPAIGPTEDMPSPPRSDKDRNCSLCGRIAGRWALEGLAESQARLKKVDHPEETFTHYAKAPGIYLVSQGTQTLRLDLKLATPRDILLDRLERQAAASGGRDPWILISQDYAYSPGDLDTRSYASREVRRMARIPLSRIRQGTEANWRNFWAHSAVEFKDKKLERIWYHNQFFLACCVRERKVAPGLFGNWSTGRIGTAWHSDYHMDYNCQQVFWGVFSSNHVEQHLPYVELCQNLMAMSERYAKEKFGLPGAYFPHSAYPVPSQMVPYPVPPWGYQISETPWTVQSLWWQYLYTQDLDYLRKVYPILRAAAQFVAAYVKKGDDGQYHFIPTVSSENWGFTVDFRLNQDCILDLALTQFLLNAVIEGSTALGEDEAERAGWKEILEKLAPYPTAQGPYGEVWLDVKNAPVEWIYNVPITLAPVFPAEQIGIGRGEEQWEIARRTARLLRLEGGNDLVFQPMIRARLGMLDLEWFKQQVRYCILPDRIANDRIRQVGGRYNDSTNFDFMMRMGVWTENFSLPGVLNECMLQSYTGTIRLFPNTNNLGPARFQRLRAAGAFLVSASHNGKQVTSISILSEKGREVRIAQPWPGGRIRVTRTRDRQSLPIQEEKGVFTFPTEPGHEYQITKA